MFHGVGKVLSTLVSIVPDTTAGAKSADIDRHLQIFLLS